MKKIILAFTLLLGYSFCVAQISLPKTDPGSVSIPKDFVKPPAIGDVSKTTGGIVNDLSSKLSLPAAQKPQLTDAIGGFLNQKKGIAGLANTNPTDYLSKFSGLQKGLFGKMKGIMGATNFTKFLGLKPSGSGIGGNVLSNLFF